MSQYRILSVSSRGVLHAIVNDGCKTFCGKNVTKIMARQANSIRSISCDVCRQELSDFANEVVIKSGRPLLMGSGEPAQRTSVLLVCDKGEHQK